MHKLESLDLIGFKSFCEKTSVAFNDRVTSIVGPNGCGKSNVAEAISWVLGEQRPKTLRSERMEDVIFNGTAARKASGFVEVSLTLKPVKIQVDVDDGITADNITITRRLYRSGESEYLINNRRCRLLDIHQTFEGTGLGFTNYAIIEQGRIGSILTSKPMERRSLIEEAAKIITFKQKKKAAEVKLELAHQNLLRINDIIVEIERQLRSLKRQAGRAQAYSRLREEMRAFHRIKLHHDYQKLHALLLQQQEQIQALRQREDQATWSLREIEESVHQASRSQAELMSGLDRNREELSSVSLRLEKAIQTRQSQQQQIEMTRLQIETLQQDIAECERRLKEVRDELAIKNASSNDLNIELTAIRERMERFKAENRDVLSRSDSLEERLNQVRTYSLEEVGRKATLNNQSLQIEEDLQELASQETRILADRDKVNSRCAELQASESRTLEQCREAQKHIERLQEEERQLERSFAQSVAAESSADAELQSLRERHGSYQHRLASIEEIEVRRANYSEGVQKFLNFIQQHNSLRSSGTLADHVDTDPQYEAMVETFLADELEFVLVEGVSDALSGLHQLRESRSGKCTFLALASANGFSQNGNGHPPADPSRGIIGTFGDILKMTEPVKKAFYRALPQYANAVVVQDIQTAQGLSQHYPESIFVTLAGETWTQRGLVSGVGEPSHTSGLLALKREKRELISRVEALQQQIQKTEAHVQQMKDERRRVEQEQKEQRARIHEREKDLISLQHQYNHTIADLQREEQATRVFNNELEQLRFERDRMAQESLRIDGELQSIAQMGVDREQEFGQIQETLAALRDRSRELGRLLSENQADLAAKLERKSGADQEAGRLVEEENQFSGRLRRQQEQLSAAARRVSDLELSNGHLAEEAEKLAIQKQTLEVQVTDDRSCSAELQERLQQHQQSLESAHRAKEAILQERMQLEVTGARLASDLDHLRGYCVEEFAVPIEELPAPVPEGWEEHSFEEMRAEFDRLKAKVDDFGPINMSALEEYKENEERFDFLSGQRSDIEKSIADTQQAIQEISRRSRQQFLDAFEAINARFKEMFQLLFGGGECGMALMDESDVLESGIDIYAQPPGKKLQNVMLLSGGEKALTAFALLIAIFKYRPSPFCVLDEVDAPLDEANIRRFATLVQHMSDVTQFILITHNKRTMEISQSIYGVTMEEPGVSKVVSVNFN
ncbi:MAG TPA: chromosome segregation protein SMC [Acidobacteriota bacterium]